MLKGHLPRVVYHQVYSYTKIRIGALQTACGRGARLASASALPCRYSCCFTLDALLLMLYSCRCSCCFTLASTSVRVTSALFTYWYPLYILALYESRHLNCGLNPKSQTRCGVYMAHIRQSRPDYGLGLQVKVRQPF